MKTYFLNMTDNEIRFIIKLLYGTEANEQILDIKRLEDSITVYMEAYIYENGKYIRLNDNDEFVMTSNTIDSYGFCDYNSQSKNIIYQKFLFARGYHWIDKENDFL